jgi:hypothetical protein
LIAITSALVAEISAAKAVSNESIDPLIAVTSELVATISADNANSILSN